MKTTNKYSKKPNLHQKKRQANIDEILNIIKDFTNEYGYSPTNRDILNRSSLKSVSSVHGYVCELEKEGLVVRTGNKSRSIQLTRKGKRNAPTSLPQVKAVNTGLPLTTKENIAKHINLPKELVKAGSFVFVAQDSSMKDAGILENDRLIIKQQNFAESGQIVLAIVNNKPVVKAFEDIVFPDGGSNLGNKIIGVVIGSFRLYN